MDINKISRSEFKGLLNQLSSLAEGSTLVSADKYTQFDVKRGLRDKNGKGVVAGLTQISEILAFKQENSVNVPIEGELYYRGISIEDIVEGFSTEDRPGFEETIFLLLFGVLPNKQEYDSFCNLLYTLRTLPENFVRDVIMKKPSKDIMNALARSVLTLYAYDPNPDDISIENVLRQSLSLISKFSLLSIYSYRVYKHYHHGGDLSIRKPKRDLSIAENILYMLRGTGHYSKLEARVLDLCLVLHAEHGGGNNSTFTNHVVSSSGTDTYSATAASLGSLKGPRHGGANVKVVQMFEDLKNNVNDYSEESLRNYIIKLLNKEAFDKSGLVYGIGHAVYSLSDPRANIFKRFVKSLAVEKGMEKEYDLYKSVARIAISEIQQRRNIYKGVSPNVDFYSGLVYKMLALPYELYTPLFAISRVAGWSAHRIEELSNRGKIIRPGYTSVAERQPYIPFDDRK